MESENYSPELWKDGNITLFVPATRSARSRNTKGTSEKKYCAFSSFGTFFENVNAFNDTSPRTRRLNYLANICERKRQKKTEFFSYLSSKPMGECCSHTRIDRPSWGFGTVDPGDSRRLVLPQHLWGVSPPSRRWRGQCHQRAGKKIYISIVIQKYEINLGNQAGVKIQNFSSRVKRRPNRS